MQSKSSNVESLASGVDWLTVTCKRSDHRGLIYREATRLFDQAKQAGWVQKPWKFKGYNGWKCAGLRWGSREDSDIVMLSGESAALNWMVFLSWATNVSRLDLAVTVSLMKPIKNVAKRVYAKKVADGKKPCRYAKTYSYVENNQGGQTLYIGSRASDQFARIYDKGKEDRSLSKIAVGKIWRYEIEFKQYRARRVARQLLEQASQDFDGARKSIGQTVYKWFLSREIPLIWQTDEGLAYSTETYAKVTDVDTQLQWLSTQVSPTVKRLIEGGNGTQVLLALGLSDIDIDENV